MLIILSKTFTWFEENLECIKWNYGYQKLQYNLLKKEPIFFDLIIILEFNEFFYIILIYVQALKSFLWGSTHAKLMQRSVYVGVFNRVVPNLERYFHEYRDGLLQFLNSIQIRKCTLRSVPSLLVSFYYKHVIFQSKFTKEYQGEIFEARLNIFQNSIYLRIEILWCFTRFIHCFRAER